MLDPCLDRLPKLQSGRVAAPSSHGTWEHLNIGHGGTEHAMGLKVRFKPQKSQEILLQDIEMFFEPYQNLSESSVRPFLRADIATYCQ